MAKVTIPIGPQHPALKEPANFSITLEGERVVKTGMRLGYNHRGIEKACEERSYIQCLYLLERICGICSHTHATAYVQAVEEIAGLDVPPRALYIRSLVGELERIHSHLLWLGVAGHEIGFDTLLMYTWRDRETVMDILALLTGNRVNYGINTIGGVRRDISPEQSSRTIEGINDLEERTRYYAELAESEPTLIARLSGVGRLSREDALRLSAVGPTLRASGVARDIRRDDPYAAYADLQFAVVTDDHCDVYGRTLVRIGELMQSFRLIRQILENLPDGPLTVKAPRKIPVGETLSRYEAPRGECVHYVRGNGSDRPERVKVRASTYANLQAVSHMMANNNLADVPIIIAAIDPCFSCTDRCVRLRGEIKGLVAWDEMRRQGIEWYRRNRGVDFDELNRKLRARRGD